ncbi:MAG: DUF92 domain-containing protein [Acidobacteriia bacterium]|nr:DUF92 domain-containing protein [Terriglobia bacterium]
MVTVAFTALARSVRGVSPSGACTGAVVCYLLYASAGLGAFLALVSVFVLAWITTRLGYQRKQALGTAEKRDGRTASQVLANLGTAAIAAALYAVTGGKTVFLLAVTAALSEAAADTVSSELGQASSEQARLITTWETVPAGTDGGISWAGTLAGIAGAAVVSLVSAAAGMLPWKWLGPAIVAAVAGMVADSYLGATLERRGVLNNDSVNFLSTVVAAGIAGLLA